MKIKIVSVAVVLGLCLAGTGAAFAQGSADLSNNVSGDLRSGSLYTTAATLGVQFDDGQNPAFLWVDEGPELWNKVEGKAGKACATCHQKAEVTMKGVRATYPKFNKESGKVLNLEQRINKCRKDNMQAKPWKWESDELLGMTAYIGLQSRGMKVNVSIDGGAAATYEKGKKFYFQRRGLMDMACANCHIEGAGKTIRADLISQGHTNGFPTYRLKWQKIGSLHRRFRGCNKQVRAKPFKNGSDEYTALELYVTHRGNGLKVETPSVRR